MSALSTLFEPFLRERPYLKNVTPKTVVWYRRLLGVHTHGDGRRTGRPQQAAAAH
jgi:hypothetical protein